MARIKPPLIFAGGTWSSSKFFGFLRSSLRRRFIVWPPNSQCRNASKRKYVGENARQKFEYQCAKCQEWKMGKEINVHHKEPCGSLVCFEDLPGFVERLFCNADKLEVLCEKCHKEEHHGI